MARRNEHTQAEIKGMILNAAESIVAKEGVQALKVRTITADIGYTVGTFYMIYGGLNALIQELKGRILDDLAAELQGVNVDDDDPEQAVIDSARRYLMFANQHYHRWRLLFDPQQTDQDGLPDWYQQKVDVLFANIERLFQRMTPEATEEQARQGARALWSGVHGVCVLSLTGSLDAVGINTIEQTLDLLVQNFLYGWRHRH